jgi:SAM-dependent methyltransferase
MGFSEFDLDRDDLRLHAGIYQVAARQFEPGRVLDVGSELGVGICLMQTENPALTFIGCDIDQRVFRSADQFDWSAVQDRTQADAARLPLAGDSLSGVCLINILHLVPDPQDLVAEAFRVLRPNGKVIIFVDMSKLPIWWKEGVLRRKIDNLLDSQFQIASNREFLDQTWEIVGGQRPSGSEIFLRIGVKL